MLYYAELLFPHKWPLDDFKKAFMERFPGSEIYVDMECSIERLPLRERDLHIYCTHDHEEMDEFLREYGRAQGFVLNHGERKYPK